MLKKFISDTSHKISKIYYFTDGAASQYKNYKNICNLLYHCDNFGLDAEWHFFATSHGKNACDGIGGTVKRGASNASLRATTSGHILTSLQLFEWCSMHRTGLGLFYISKEEIEQSSLYLNARFKKTHKIPGIRSFHCFILNSNKELQVNRISGTETDDLISISPANKVSNISQVEEYSLGQFISQCNLDYPDSFGPNKTVRISYSPDKRGRFIHSGIGMGLVSMFG